MNLILSFPAALARISSTPAALPPLTRICPACEGLGRLGAGGLIGPEEYRRTETCYRCDGACRLPVWCEDCGRPAQGRDDGGDALCCECAERLGVALEVT